MAPGRIRNLAQVGPNSQLERKVTDPICEFSVVLCAGSSAALEGRTMHYSVVSAACLQNLSVAAWVLVEVVSDRE